MVGNESKWKFRKVPPPSTTQMIIVLVSGALLLPFKSLQDFNISLFGVLSFWHPDNILTSSTMLQQELLFIYLFTDSRQFLVLTFFIVKSINFSEIHDFSAFVLIVRLTQNNTHHSFCLCCSVKSCVKTGRPQKPICHLVLTNKLLTYFGCLSWQHKVLMLRSNTAQ